MARRRRMSNVVSKRLKLTVINAEINDEAKDFISLSHISTMKEAWMYVIGEMDMEADTRVIITGYQEIDGIYGMDVKTFYEHAKRIDLSDYEEEES